MRDAGDHYEYVCVYVDDLLAIMKEPEKFFKTLTETYKYKLKGVEAPQYHLGGNYFRDPDGTLGWGAQRYITRMLENLLREEGVDPPKYRSPMEKGAHPELDMSSPLDANGIKKYQSLIGALQWCVTLGRFDINCAVMTMSRFRAEPRENHWKMLHRILGYLKHTKDAAIRLRTIIPEYCHYTTPCYHWSQTVPPAVITQPTASSVSLSDMTAITAPVEANAQLDRAYTSQQFTCVPFRQHLRHLQGCRVNQSLQDKQ